MKECCKETYKETIKEILHHIKSDKQASLYKIIKALELVLKLLNRENENDK